MASEAFAVLYLAIKNKKGLAAEIATSYIADDLSKQELYHIILNICHYRHFKIWLKFVTYVMFSGAIETNFNDLND